MRAMVLSRGYYRERSRVELASSDDGRGAAALTRRGAAMVEQRAVRLVSNCRQEVAEIRLYQDRRQRSAR